jgi:CSLREA domain-containing protein
MLRFHEADSRSRARRTRTVAGIAALAFTAIAWRAPAATFTVNSNADTTDGVCGPAIGGCTLREAIAAVVATPGRDTITFDAGVFPKAPGTAGIIVNSALPVIADPAGTVIDGGSGRVQVSAAGGVMGDGLAFESAPGVPLVKVTVANIVLTGFSGTAVHFCGGVRPDCDADVSGALVRNVVAVAAGGDGIRIAGRVVTKARVIDSVAWPSGGAGIRVFGSQSIVGARIQGSTARQSEEEGIALVAGVDVIGASIVDSIARQGHSVGILVQGDTVTKTKITNVVVNGNGDGLVVRATNGNSATSISDAFAFDHPGDGIQIAGASITAATVKRAAADGDDTTGILLSMAPSQALS